MKKFYILFCLVSFAYYVQAQNITVSGLVVADTTWSADTVFVNGDVLVVDTATLTIDPGTIIIFNDFYGITVQGTLKSVGTEDQMITFTVIDTSGYSSNFSHTGWDGIHFDNAGGDMDDNDSSHIAYSAFYFASEYDNWDGAGAIRINNFSKIIIEYSLFQFNYAISMGGALGIEEGAEPVISHCTFLNNYAKDGGGAIHVGHSNEVHYPVITNCYFKANGCLSANYGGGAIKLSGYNMAHVINNTFIDNKSTGFGGAIMISGYCNPYLINNLLAGNSAEYNGGAIGIKYQAGGYFINNTIINNTSDNYGGAVSIGCNNDSVFFMNNIIGENTCDSADFNQFYIAGEDSLMFFYNNNIQGGLDSIPDIIYVDNIDEDPLMLDPDGGDYRLFCESPCKDAGKDTMSYYPDLDLSGVTRLVGSTYDMGAYEVQEITAVNLGADQTISDIGSTLLDAGAGYKLYSWTTDETTQTITIDGSTVGVGDHTIGVTVTNEYLCESSDEVVISVIDHSLDLEDYKTTGISVYPNPSRGIIHIESVSGSEISITDLNGRVIGTYTPEDIFTIDLSSYGKGVYLMTVTTNENTLVYRIIIN